MIKHFRIFNCNLILNQKERFIEFCNYIINSEEFEASKSVVENNICHHNETVYTHTLNMFKQFQELLQFEFVESGKVRETAKIYFSQLVGRWTKKELILLSVLLHDLGKTKTLTKDVNGNTKAIGHEFQSVKIARKLLRRLNFKDREILYTTELVRLHSGYPLKFLDFLNNLPKVKLREAFRPIQFLPEIFLYMMADNQSSKAFKRYKKIIIRFMSIPEIYQDKCAPENSANMGKAIEQSLLLLKKHSKPWPTEIRLLHLSEEVGELHDVYLQYIGAKGKEQKIKDIRNALNDIFVETLALYDLFGIDITNSLNEFAKEYGK